jgi:hypothetical protein
MAKKLGVLIIHGMGSQVEGFECDLVKELIARVDGDANDVAWQGVYWQDITEPREREYLEKAGEMVDLDWDKARGFMAAAFGDAAAYQFTGTGGTYGRIHDRIRARMHDLYVNKLESTDVPLLVLAHSSGGHMMSNYIWDMQPNLKGEVRAKWSEGLSPFERAETLAGFITFGCNIALFSFAYDHPRPISFPGSALSTEDAERAAWLNYYDKDDILGWPLQPLSPEFAATVTADIAINLGSVLTAGTPLSHVGYSTDNDFTKPVAKFISKFLWGLSIRDR